MSTVIVILVIVGVLAVGFYMANEREKQRAVTDPQIVCPHCHVTGKVHTRDVRQKKGISGGKATGAILTGGVSMLGTGLSRKENAVQLHCDNCQMTWAVAA